MNNLLFVICFLVAATPHYGIFNDGTISTIAGVPQIHFHREASSLEEAIRSAMLDVSSTGLGVTRVEIEPETAVQHS